MSDYIIDSLDGIPERARGAFVEHEGKFKFDPSKIDDYKELKGSIEKERQAAKEAKAELAKYSGIKDPEQYKNLMSRLENDEEARLIAEGKISDVIAKRTEKQREESDRQVKEAQSKAEAAEARAMAFQGRVLGDAIREAAVAAGVHKHAIDDVLLRGKSIFTLDENGKAVQLDSDGQPVLGKDGKSSFGASEWIESMKDKAPHWFPVNNAGSPPSGKQMKQGGKDFSNLPPVERLTAARAAQAAKRA